MTLQELLQYVHSIPTPEELESELDSIRTDIDNAITAGGSFQENYYKNHTGRELFRKLHNFGLEHLIFDDYDGGFRPLSINGITPYIEILGGNSANPFTFNANDLQNTLQLKLTQSDEGKIEIFITYTTTDEDFVFILDHFVNELVIKDGATMDTIGELKVGEAAQHTLTSNDILKFEFIGQDEGGSFLVNIKIDG